MKPTPIDLGLKHISHDAAWIDARIWRNKEGPKGNLARAYLHYHDALVKLKKDLP